MKKCQTNKCENNVDWIDEPEDLCSQCLEVAIKEYERHLTNVAVLGLAI